MQCVKPHIRVSGTALSHGLSVIAKAIALGGVLGSQEMTPCGAVASIIVPESDGGGCAPHSRALSPCRGQSILFSGASSGRKVRRYSSSFRRITGGSDVAELKAAAATASLALEGSLSTASAMCSRSSSLCLASRDRVGKQVIRSRLWLCSLAANRTTGGWRDGGGMEGDGGMEEQQCHRLRGHLLGHTAVHSVVAIVADGHWYCLSRSLLVAVHRPPGATPKGRECSSQYHDANQWLYSLIVRPSWGASTA